MTRCEICGESGKQSYGPYASHTLCGIHADEWLSYFDKRAPLFKVPMVEAERLWDGFVASRRSMLKLRMIISEMKTFGLLPE